MQDLKTPQGAQKAKEGSKNAANALKHRHPFHLQDHLFYNYNKEGNKRLVVPRSLVQELLQDAYNNYYHFRHNQIITTLNQVHFQCKRYAVDKYIKGCHACSIYYNKN